MATSPFRVHRFRLVFTISWVLLIIVQVKLLQWYQFTLYTASMDSIISNVLLAGSCVLITTTLNYYLPVKSQYSYLIALVTIISLIWLLISRILLMLLTDNVNEYDHFFTQSLPIRMAVAFLVLGSMALFSVLWYTLQEQREHEQRRNEAERLAKEAELNKLRQQLQPHFLFNSLNSINALIGLKPQEARSMIQQLSDFLRGTLKKEENSLESLEDEFRHLQLYLDIEKVRFGHRLSTLIENDVEGKGYVLPSMLLQPLVENAIKFGLYDTIGSITISIKAKAVDHTLVISVENPFDPVTTHPKTGTGFGLSSVQRRLFLLFGRNDLLETSVQENLFITTVKIPQVHESNTNR